MPFQLGVPELLILLVILLLFFGGGRIVSIARDLGRGVRELREGFSNREEKAESLPSTRDASGGNAV